MNTLHYWSGQRKRKQTGTILETETCGNQKAFKIKKRTRLAWINERDVVNVETKAEETSLVGQDEGGNKAANESHLTSETIALEIQTDQTPLKEESQGGTPIPQNEPGMAQGKALRVSRVQTGGESDLFSPSSSGNGDSSFQRPSAVDVEPSGILESSVRCEPSVCASESNGGEEAWPAAFRLEHPTLSDSIEKAKERILNAVAEGKSLSEFANAIGTLARCNDREFFVEFGIACKKRKTVK